MNIRLCRTALQRLGPGAGALIGALREREHIPLVQDCLDRCPVCEKGILVAVADGIPIQAPEPGALLALIDELARDD